MRGINDVCAVIFASTHLSKGAYSDALMKYFHKCFHNHAHYAHLHDNDTKAHVLACFFLFKLPVARTAGFQIKDREILSPTSVHEKVVQRGGCPY